METARRIRRTILFSIVLSLGLGAVATSGFAQWGWGGYGGAYGSYGYGGEGCGGINCEGDGWDGGYSDMKDAEQAAADARSGRSQDVFAGGAPKGRLCNSKMPMYNGWGDFTGYKPVKIPCKSP
jgi:hypothetical protein